MKRCLFILRGYLCFLRSLPSYYHRNYCTASSTMHFTPILITLFSALAAAQTNQCAGNKATIGHCETLSYVDRTSTSTSPPSTADCQNTCRGILSDAGDWSVNFKGSPPSLPSSQHPITQSTTSMITQGKPKSLTPLRPTHRLPPSPQPRRLRLQHGPRPRPAPRLPILHGQPRHRRHLRRSQHALCAAARRARCCRRPNHLRRVQCNMGRGFLSLGHGTHIVQNVKERLVYLIAS
jgi:hypothetical protein